MPFLELGCVPATWTLFFSMPKLQRSQQTDSVREQLKSLRAEIVAQFRRGDLEAFVIACQSCEAYMRKVGLWKGRANYGKSGRFEAYWAKRRAKKEQAK
jgi:hypothetical protein